MNKTILLGRLTRDPEIRYTQTGACVAQFTLAVDRPVANQDGEKEADFIQCVAWSKTAEVIGNHVHKGQRLLVEGRLQIRSYDAKDGSKRWVTEVIVNHGEFIERKEQQENQQKNRPAKQRPPAVEDWTTMGSQIFDEEIPF